MTVADVARHFQLDWKTVIMKPRKGDWFEGCGRISEQTRLYEPEDVDEADRLLAEAMRKAETDLQRERIEFIARWWRYAALHINALASSTSSAFFLYEDKFDQLVAARLKRDNRSLIWLKCGDSSARPERRRPS